MIIPQYPESREIRLEDRPVFDRIFAARSPQLSAYNFTNIFAWREPHNTGLSKIGENIIVHYNPEDRRICLEPLGEDDPAAVVEEAFRRGEGTVMEFKFFHHETAVIFHDRPEYSVKPDRDNFDYLYLASDLIDLPGRKFDAKRNFINRLKSQIEYEYLPITEEIIEESRDFVTRWCEDRGPDCVGGLARERDAIREMLANYTLFNLRGGVIRVDGSIAALSIGEALNPETLVVHVEKADTGLTGMYQLINNEFCVHEARDFQYVNREQDLGVPGLRKAKISYHPIRMLESYRVKRTCHKR